jgi:hypothetical protein
MVEQREQEGIGYLVAAVIRQIGIVIGHARSTESARSGVEVITLTQRHPPGMTVAAIAVEHMKAKAATAHPSSLMRSCLRTSSLEYDSWLTAASLGSVGRLVVSE